MSTNTFSIKSGIAATDSQHIKLEREAATAVSTQTFELSDTATGNSILLDSNSTGKNASLLLENTAAPFGNVTVMYRGSVSGLYISKSYSPPR